MDELNRFYVAAGRAQGDHLALSWKGRVRYTVPRALAGQQVCWDVFRPGPLRIPLSAMGRLPRLLGAGACVEGPQMETMRKASGGKAGLSCCRSGAAGPWSKDTILFLDGSSAKAMLFVKAATGAAVDALLTNEADWLRRLAGQSELRDHVPALVAHRCGAELCFVGQLPLSGAVTVEFGEPHAAFLRKLQTYNCQWMRLEETRLHRTLGLRLRALSGLLSAVWAARLERSIQRLARSLDGKPALFVSAHNDFTPWNTRVEGNVARAFDWEYADTEQFPLFDAIHFHLLPLGLRRQSVARMSEGIAKAVACCRRWIGDEVCYLPEVQALAYLVNLTTLYLHAEGGQAEANPVLDSYGQLIDRLCRREARPQAFA